MHRTWFFVRDSVYRDACDSSPGLITHMVELNYEAVNKYWHTARPSILGPYMMDGFGFPAAAGQFRFRAETRIMKRLISGLSPAGAVLDLGSGVGFWAEHFAEHFAKVVAVEASTPP